MWKLGRRSNIAAGNVTSHKRLSNQPYNIHKRAGEILKTGQRKGKRKAGTISGSC